MSKPEPLVGPEVDVRDLDGFMLNVERLLASELVAIGTPEECWAALMLWCRAWKQMPAGSLPNDEKVLASFSGAGVRWKKVREVALRGFIECLDGRLYHRVLCEEAQRAFARKQTFQKRREGDRKRLASWRKDRGKSEREWSDIRAEVFERDMHRCTRCGSPDDLHCDHIVDAADGGPSEMGNLTTLCRTCHSRKTASRMHGEIGREMPGEMPGEMHFVAEGTGTGTGTGTLSKEERESGPTPESPKPRTESSGTAQAPVSRYGFVGEVIRLTRKDLAAWKQTYHAIPDIEAELRTLDAYYSSLPDEDKRRWFIRCSAALDKRHQAAVRATKEQEQKPTGPGISWTIGVG